MDESFSDPTFPEDPMNYSVELLLQASGNHEPSLAQPATTDNLGSTFIENRSSSDPSPSDLSKQERRKTQAPKLGRFLFKKLNRLVSCKNHRAEDAAEPPASEPTLVIPNDDSGATKAADYDSDAKTEIRKLQLRCKELEERLESIAVVVRAAVAEEMQTQMSTLRESMAVEVRAAVEEETQTQMSTLREQNKSIITMLRACLQDKDDACVIEQQEDDLQERGQLIDQVHTLEGQLTKQEHSSKEKEELIADNHVTMRDTRRQRNFEERSGIASQMPFASLTNNVTAVRSRDDSGLPGTPDLTDTSCTFSDESCVRTVKQARGAALRNTLASLPEKPEGTTAADDDDDDDELGVAVAAHYQTSASSTISDDENCVRTVKQNRGAACQTTLSHWSGQPDPMPSSSSRSRDSFGPKRLERLFQSGSHNSKDTAHSDQDEPDKKKHAIRVAARTRSTTRAAALTEFIPERFKLTDFANEILVQVYSFLCLKERQVTRRFCHQLLEFVDNYTPGAEELVVSITPCDGIVVSPESPEKVFLNLAKPRRGEFRLTGIPPLRNIRPNKLCLDVAPKLLAKILQHLVVEQVARSVMSIKFDQGLAPGGITTEAREAACSMFDRASETRVQTLDLGPLNRLSGRPREVLPLQVCFPRLVCLKFDLTSCYFRDARGHFLSLQQHQTLREVCVMGSPNTVPFPEIILEVNTELMTTLATIVQLQKLTFEINLYHPLCEAPQGSQMAELVRVFGNMLRGLKNLTSLSMQLVGTNRFWQCLAESGVVSKSIGELTFLHRGYQSTGEEVKALVSGLITAFPSMHTLVVSHVSVDLDDPDFMIALSGLARHPSLKRFEYRPEWLDADEDKKMFLVDLQQTLGKKTKLVVHG